MEQLPKDIIKLLMLDYLDLDSYESFSCSAKFAYNALSTQERRFRVDIKYCVENNRIDYLRFHRLHCAWSRYSYIDDIYKCALLFNPKLIERLRKELKDNGMRIQHLEEEKTRRTERRCNGKCRTEIYTNVARCIKYNQYEELKLIPKDELLVKSDNLTICSNLSMLEYLIKNAKITGDFDHVFFKKVHPSVLKYMFDNWNLR